MDKSLFSGKLAVQQRVLTPYRAAFFDTLAGACKGGLSVFAGLARPEDNLTDTDQLHVARYVPAHNLNILRGSMYTCYQLGLVDWLVDWDPDVLIVEANRRYLATPTATRWMRARHRPVLGWGLGTPSLMGALAGSRKNQYLYFLKQFDALLTYSRRGATEYTAMGFPADRIFIAPNAAAARPSAPPPRRRPSFEKRPVILFVGRLQSRKRVDLLLHACADLPKTLQPRLIIVGDGPEHLTLEALARTIYPSTEFPGAKHGAELAPYFSAADLFVLPGTGGLAVQEAMSYGLPVIMGQGDGTNDDLVRPGNGWQIPPDDLAALTETIKQALGNVKRLRTMGAESYRIVSEEINLEKMVGVFIEAVNRISQS